MDGCFFVLEMIGVIAFAISGALTALRSDMDILGICMLGMITAVGGGIIRDILLGVSPPTALQKPGAALLAIIVSTFCSFFAPKLSHSPKVVKVCSGINLTLDSVGLAVFTIVGINSAYNILPQANVFATVFYGTVTAVGGGILRDILSDNKPAIFVKDFYACASILGALIYVLLLFLCNKAVASVIGIVFILIIRFVAAKFHWQLLRPKELTKNNDI